MAQCSSPEDNSGSKPLNGYFLQKSTVALQAESTWPQNYGIAVLCPGSMEKKDLPSEVTAGDSGDGNGGNGKEHANHITCCMLDDWSSNVMLPTGGVVLHEFLHWEYLTSGALGLNDQREPQSIRDWNYPPEPNVSPPDGYGPNNCALLRARGDSAPLLNADSYVWYALEAFWRKACPGKPFELFAKPS